MGGVERARARVRELTPLLFNFDFNVSQREDDFKENRATYNYEVAKFEASELPGISCFIKIKFLT